MLDNISSKSVRREIDKINVKRGYGLSVVMAVAFFLCAIVKWIATRQILSCANIMLAFLVEIVYICMFYSLKKEGLTRKARGVYISYFALNSIICFMFAIKEITYSGSILFYVLSMVGVVFLPVLRRNIRRIFQAAVVVFSVTGCTLGIVFGREIRSVVDLGAISLVCLILMEYQQSMHIKNAAMELKLKKNKKSSEHDALTGLMNRRGLEHRVATFWEKCISEKIPVAMIELDIDFFKKYNDAFGHPKGDECLKIVSAAIVEAVDGKAIVTRTGGEEFIVLAYGMSRKELINLAMKIRTVIHKKKIKQEYVAISNYVTVSMGAYYAVPSFDDDLSIYYDEADKALYMAKENGRNCLVFEGDLYGRMKNEALRLEVKDIKA